MKYEIELDEHEETALRDFIADSKKRKGVVLNEDFVLHTFIDLGLEELGYG